MPNQSGKILLTLILFFLILGGALYFSLPVLKKEFKEQIPTLPVQQSIDLEKSSKPSSMTSDYYSKSLKISFKVPENAKVEEKFTDVLISLPDGKIQIRRIGTNFSNIKEYFKNLKELNKLNLLTEEEKQISTYNTIVTTMQDPNSEQRILKEYSLYINSWVFKFSTSDEALYPILDQIVQSFEYRP